MDNMGQTALTSLHIVANTSSSTEAFARRTNEIAKFVSGLGRQNDELQRCVACENGKRLTLVRADPTLKERTVDDRIVRCTLPLADTIGTTNPNTIYRKAKTIEELRSAFGPLIESMEELVKDADVVLLGGTYFVPWALLQAARNQGKPVVLCYAGILSMEIAHLPDDIQSTLKLMEQDFSDPNIFYIFPSALTQKTVEGIFGHPVQNSRVVFNGVPPEFFDCCPVHKKEVDVAFVGRNTSVKNPEFMLDLAREFAKRRNGRNIHMVTKVDPKNTLINELKKASVVVHEPKDTPGLAAFYSSTSVVLCPSHFETYGNVPLEAVSSGTPAFVSPNMGVTEVFGEYGLTGLITQFLDTGAVAEKIEQFIRDGLSVPSTVRSQIRDKLNWPHVIGKYLDICASHAVAPQFIPEPQTITSAP
jgi:glycosyltransferase involved in cell wall biosynthesis